jgi:GPH family glycoside/pentoside/hexuronide:cation symporter
MNSTGASEPTTTATGGKPYTAPARQIWAWGVGALACHLLIQTYGQANVIFTVGFGLSPVLVSWCMTLPRVLDGVTDPIIGHLSDNTHTRWGRRKPYLVLGATVGAVLLAAIWWANPRWSSTAQFVYLLTFGALFYIAYGMYTMAWSAVGYELTDDYHDRSKVAAIGSFFLAIVALTAGWMYWLALRPIFGNEIRGMRWIGGVVGVVIIFSAFVAAVSCRERFAHANREHAPIGTAIKETLRNRPFVILQLVGVFQMFAQRLGVNGFLIYIGIYYVCGGDKSLATKIAAMGGTIGTVLIFALLPLIKPITKRIGKRGALLAGSGIGFVFALIQPFTLSQSHPYLLLLPALVITPLTTFCYTIINSIVPDICDLDELQNGNRREGLFTAVMGFVSKMGISLSFLAIGYLLSWSGLDTKISAQPPEVMHRLFWLAVLPNTLFSFGALAFTLLFPMTESGVAEVRRHLDERRLAKATVGEPTDEVAEEFVHEHPRQAREFIRQHPQVIEEISRENASPTPSDCTGTEPASPKS